MSRQEFSEASKKLAEKMTMSKDVYMRDYEYDPIRKGSYNALGERAPWEKEQED